MENSKAVNEATCKQTPELLVETAVQEETGLDTAEEIQESVDSNDAANITEEKAGGDDCAESPDTQHCAKEAEADPYAYLSRDNYTTEIFKIEINQLPKKLGIVQLRKRLQNLGLKPGKIKLPHRGHHAFVNFRCEEDRDTALEVLEGYEWKQQKLTVKKANPTADPLVKKKREMEDQDGERGGKVAKLENTEVDNRSITERLNDAVTPLWKMSYENQLEGKLKKAKEFLTDIGRKIERENAQMREFINKQRQEYDGLCCELCPVLPSPVETGYRTKCEFSVGKNTGGVDNVCGFRLGQYRHGSVAIEEPYDTIHIPDSMKTALKGIQSYLQNHSALTGFDQETHAGNWRQVTLRTTQSGHVMAMLQLQPRNLTPDQIEEENKKIKDYFESEEGRHHGITALYAEVVSDSFSHPNSGGKKTLHHLSGDQHITEDLLGLKFRISPGAFFQVNTLAAEELYKKVAEWCELTPNSTVLDVCCGTGTIGLSVAKHAGSVVGIELCEEAVEDAKENAKLNGITNTRFHCGKAEDVLPRLINSCYSKHSVAILDPPRAGIHQDVIRAIRRSAFIRTLVYVSCHAKGATNNILD